MLPPQAPQQAPARGRSMASGTLLRVLLFGLVVGIQGFSFQGSPCVVQPAAKNPLPRRSFVSTRTQRTAVFSPPHGVRSLSAISGDGIQKLKLVLRQYGVPVVVTHATGWFVSMAILYSLFSSGVDLKSIISILPHSIKDHVDVVGAAELVRLQLSLLITEAIGPARLGLTLAITPEISRYMRSYQTTRDLEAFILRRATSNIRRLRAMWGASPAPLSVANQPSSSSLFDDSQNSSEGGVSLADPPSPPKPTPRPEVKTK